MKERKAILPIAAWCAYDSGCASFSIIVTTFIFSTYFTTSVAKNSIIGTYQWANAAALAGLIIAITAPLFGAISDYAGQHKRWLGFFTLVSIVSTGLLWFAYPDTKSVYLTLTLVVIGTVGYEIAQVFYNTFLSILAPPNYIGRISGWGWGCGYLGGIVALTLALFAFVKFNWLGLDTKTAEQIRICGPYVAIWYFTFALPLFIFVPETPIKNANIKLAFKEGSKKWLATLKILPKEKNIFIYLAAHMIYTDGLNTLFAFGGIYAAGTYGLNFEQVLLFGITMNIAAGIGAMSLAWLDDWLGAKETLIISLICLFVLGIPILFLHDKYLFWICALFLCLFVGPVQSASRSLMVHLVADKETSGEMFGLYALSGRISAFIGPWLLGALTLLFNSQRVGMASILFFFVAGILLLAFVKKPNCI